MTLSRKVLSAVAGAILVAGTPVAAFADSGKANTKTASALDARAFFFQVRPVARPAATTHVTRVSVDRAEVAMAPCYTCQPMIVMGVGF